MSDEIGKVFDVMNEFTKIELPDGGGLETDSPVVEAAVAVGIVGAVAYGIYKLFSSDD
jgi:hypothetical protein